jgi:hypothetical protein
MLAGDLVPVVLTQNRGRLLRALRVIVVAAEQSGERGSIADPEVVMRLQAELEIGRRVAERDGRAGGQGLKDDQRRAFQG